MKKTRSTTLRRAWPSSDFSDRASDRMRSRSEKDYRLHKHFPPAFISQASRGYMTSGDVSPISMSPISQSQFIPLGEILCLAISAMNSARKPVTQEALMEHLATCFPGVPTPSPEILRHTLNMLVRERKIYPTPDGYFIVTPQTYFITPSLIRTNSKWYHLDERIPDRPPCTSPQPGTITPSTSGCIRDRGHHKNHCNCYREDMHSMHASTLQRRSAKDCKDSYCPPSLCQLPPTEKSKSTVNCSYKTETLTKSKDGEKQSKKFGLKLFRLSFKKDKTKHLATFSAQFPPEEWPLRDEDTPTTIPREVEMEIIRRINPDLTVENVTRHTALMKKLEEEKAQRSKAGSSAHHSGRSKKSRGHRKSHGKSRSHSKTRASKGDPSEGSHLDIPGEREYEFYDPASTSPREGCFVMDHKADTFVMHSNPSMIESHFPVAPEWDVSGELAKRRTEMPFPEPSRGTSHSKVHRSHSHTQDRRSRNERSNKAKERSRSMDNSKGPLGAAALGTTEDILEGSSPEEKVQSQCYTDGNTLRPPQPLSHHRPLISSANYTEPCTAETAGNTVEESNVCSSGDHSKPTESVSSYNELNSCSPKPTADDYFQCNTSNETVLTAPSPVGKHKDDHDTLTLSDGIKKLSPSNRQLQHIANESCECKEEGPNGNATVAGQTPEMVPNGRPFPHHHIEPSKLDKRKEIFSKDTLFKPLSSTLTVNYVENSYQKPGVSQLKSHHKTPSDVLSAHCEGFEQPSLTSIAQTISIPQEQSTVNQQASFDYYNVSDDEESEEGRNKATDEEKNRDDAGTMQWLLEREKERDLQRKFEKNLTLLNPKETDNSNGQRATHSARLDSMDSSSITVDSGFNSPRTRESLASNTSSIVESNRRQNPTLSPGHGGTVPAFNFRATADPPTAEPEKVQKPSNCLQASITSV
ncbi:storkhead-box protein 2 isoform X1 [Latimeria chalumnae]|uniref:Storkhead box 2 n=1 Tax=Latimeria chalumnae TaxID=7897 RepID=H2ZYV2_LATCH|nr:PREDICTED: storkhead-box protein 2 isoform X2 [Latimeria chalumnae]|eukprot:XP_005989528.1 PREDICTED: storkhead-box protein 2 isoform X2 [Latimeria chalumnae]